MSNEWKTLGEKVCKFDDELQVVFGWASVIEEFGKVVVDSQNDAIKEEVLIQAAHEFMIEERAGKVMHKGEQIAELVESIVFTHDLQTALGINLNRVGWFVAFKIPDPDIFGRVKTGELSMFSIGGRGVRVPSVIEDEMVAAK